MYDRLSALCERLLSLAFELSGDDGIDTADGGSSKGVVGAPGPPRGEYGELYCAAAAFVPGLRRGAITAGPGGGMPEGPASPYNGRPRLSWSEPTGEAGREYPSVASVLTACASVDERFGGACDC